MNFTYLTRTAVITLTLAFGVLQPTALRAGNSEASYLNLQQKKTVKGLVKDAQTGDPVIGATVIIEGTHNGVGTGLEGEFELKNVPANARLEVSMIGFKTKIVPVTADVMTITLEQDVTQLESVVVVGYGTQTRVNLTGAVASVSGKELADRPITSLSAGLQGLIPGVTITQGQGRPGQDGATIRIRGVGTLNNANPYILIDGIEGSYMSQIDPNDVESISVLKDAASAAIYGSKASNGVILITTKRGKSGKPTLSYSGSVGWQKPTKFIERLNSYDYARLFNTALTNNGKAARFTEEELQKFKDGSDPYKYPNTDWNALAFDGSGFIQRHNVNISGGVDNIKYMTSAGYLMQNGIIRNSGREQFNARTNIDVKLSDKFDVRTSLAYINNKHKDANSSYGNGDSGQIIRQVNRIAPWIVNRYEDGTYGTIGDGNPIAWLDLGQTVDRANENFTGILAIDYNVLPGLKLTAQGSFVSDSEDYKEFMKDIQYNPTKYHGPNSLTDRTYLWNRTVFNAFANYDKQFGNHSLKVMLGYQSEKYNYKEKGAFRSGFPNNNLTDIDAGTVSTQTNEGFTRQLAMLSAFGRLNYDYMGKYLLEANFRADASSRFAPDQRWGYFPSVSAGWRISEEEFMTGAQDWMQNLKIRASYGVLGNQDALDDYYPWMATYVTGANFPFNNSVSTGIYQSSFKLSTITWEKATSWDVGLDVTILQSLSLSVDVYNRKTTGIIMDVPVPATFGLGAYKDNVGAMENSGLEVTASFRKAWGDWTFSASGNFAYNKNKILDLGGVKEMPKDTWQLNRVGGEINAFYMYVADGLFQSQAEADDFTAKYGNPFGRKFMAGDIRYKDVNGDGKLNADDRKLLNSSEPRSTFGLNLSASWKWFDVSAFFQGALGVARYFNNEVYGDFTGDTSHPSTLWLDAWSPTNPGGSMPYVSESLVSPSHPSNVSSTFWMQKTNYVRLKSLQVGYTLPQHLFKGLGISRCRIYYSGENLFTIDNMRVKLDPETNSGGGSNYPIIATNSLGINLTF